MYLVISWLLIAAGVGFIGWAFMPAGVHGSEVFAAVARIITGIVLLLLGVAALAVRWFFMNLGH